jgi:hypothetical protein
MQAFLLFTWKSPAERILRFKSDFFAYKACFFSSFFDDFDRLFQSVKHALFSSLCEKGQRAANYNLC